MSDIHKQTAQLLEQLQSAATQAQIIARPKPKPDYYDTAKELAQQASHIVDDLDELQETLPPDTGPKDNGQETTNAQTTNLPTPSSLQSTMPIGFELWEALAYDLALDHTDKQTIAEAYRLTVPQLEHLQANPYFSKMFQAKKDEIKQIGSDAAFVVKMRMVANRATPQFLKRLTDRNTSTKDFHALFKTAVELAKLMPKPDEETNTPQAVIGASVTFNIQGVPGLEHLSVKQDNLSTVNTQPIGENNDVMDADWEDVIEHQNEKLSTDDELVEL